MSRALRRAAAILIAGHIAGLFSVGSASAQQPLAFEKIVKWAVSYDDRLLGRVEGVAFCDWSARQCHVTLRNPKTRSLTSLRANGAQDFSLPAKLPGAVAITLHGTSPSSDRVADRSKPGHTVKGSSGDAGKIKIKNAGTESVFERPVVESAKADRERVKLELEVQSDGALTGRWTYLASPITGRGIDGAGRVGVLKMLHDADIPESINNSSNSVGFMGQQSGGESWRPLPAQIFGVFMLDEQEAKDADGHLPRYRRPLHSPDPLAAAKNNDNTRTLIVVGRDLMWPGLRSLEGLERLRGFVGD